MRVYEYNLEIDKQPMMIWIKDSVFISSYNSCKEWITSESSYQFASDSK